MGWSWPSVLLEPDSRRDTTVPPCFRVLGPPRGTRLLLTPVENSSALHGQRDTGLTSLVRPGAPQICLSPAPGLNHCREEPLGGLFPRVGLAASTGAP